MMPSTVGMAGQQDPGKLAVGVGSQACSTHFDRFPTDVSVLRCGPVVE